MLGLVYLFVGTMVGFFLLWKLLPEYVYKKKGENLLFFVFPASFLMGMLALGWLTYASAWAASHWTNQPLLWANGIVFALCIFPIWELKDVPWKKVLPCLRPTWGGAAFLVFCFLYAGVLMCRSFWYSDGVIGIGETNAGDFEVHLSMIRSFSMMQNIPADYTLYAGSDLKYHFMFDFLAGNLEFLGLRLDLAVNLPSIFGLSGMLMALAGLASSLSGRLQTGYLAGILAAFRSSLAVFDRFFSLEEPVWENFLDSTRFVGSTILEDWGIYSPNVYANQRHYAFGMTAVFLVLFVFLPYFQEGMCNLRRYLRMWRKETNLHKDRFLMWMREDAFVIDAKGARVGVYSGLLLGMLVFWNGPAAIASLLILFVLAFFSSHKLTFAYTALLTVLSAFAQLRIFAAGADTFSIQRIHGWILQDVSFLGYARHFVMLLGVAFFLLFLYFLKEKAEKRVFFLATLAPLVFGFSVQMTRDVNQNSKYTMLTFLLFAIFYADVLECIGRFLLRKISGWTKTGKVGRFLLRTVCIFSFGVVLFSLTANGIYDYYTVCYKSTPPRAYQLKENTEFLQWVRENVDKDDLFTCPKNYMSPFTYAGVEIYLGWSLFPWTVGYDTDTRGAVQAAIYSAESKQELLEAANSANIRYIVVSSASKQYYENPAANRLIEETLPLAFSFEGFSIYEVPKKP